jgi:dedicator of cytokinesis protein 1
MEIFDYKRLSETLQRQAKFCDLITNPQSSRNVQYVLVGYYGLGFPPIVRNKEFVYRTPGSEHMTDFTERMLTQYPAAQQLKTNNAPDAKIRESNDMYILCARLIQMPGERPARFADRDVPDSLLAYYEQNDVNLFYLSKPSLRGPKTANEFESLWVERRFFFTKDTLPGLLGRSPVVKVVVSELCPIDNAIESLEQKNRELCREIDYAGPQLAQLLTGVVDAAVNGGTERYRAAFLSPEYLAEHMDDKEKQTRLVQLLLDQASIVEQGLRVFGQQATQDYKPLHRSLMEKFDITLKSYESLPGERKQYGELHAYRTRKACVLGVPPAAVLATPRPANDVAPLVCF